MKVHRIRTAVVLGVVLLWAMTPAMACLFPGATSTPAERECCHHMAAHCGQTVMPASHACCRVPSRPETIVVQGQVISPVKYATALVAAEAQLYLPNILAAPEASLGFSESPPGGPSSCSSTVLRI